MAPPEKKDPSQDGTDPRLTYRDVKKFRGESETAEKDREQASEAGSRPERPPLKPVPELHVCMGLNACAGHGRDGTGIMAGMGRCATVSHNCHGDNECAGQGGCGYSGHEAEQALPGAQHCRWSGSCASPINASRVHAAGPYRGTSVWKRARKVFEQRMFEAGVPFGPSPGEGFPDDEVPDYEARFGTRVPAPRDPGGKDAGR
ncbi:hypothetical protein GCM10009527_051120 [Actinomadura nitritigenes]|uniref:Uncharacterized protein n=1 Tax=Actinomadura nitritigenes TaxID=134602 RepID=A0ABS3R4S0_9ACTN|nr:hypothetical protein [Actinomadura nitritigenes]MBO2441240.1 hypothetical protein [Actinomadura nitritigenes]